MMVDDHNQIMKICSAHKHVRTLRFTVKKSIFIMDALMANSWIAYRFNEENKISKSSYCHEYCIKGAAKFQLDGVDFFRRMNPQQVKEKIARVQTADLLKRTATYAADFKTKCKFFPALLDHKYKGKTPEHYFLQVCRMG